VNEVEVAWVAGLLEGEGYFCGVNRTRRTPEPIVQLSMQDRDVVEKFRSILGGTQSITAYDRMGQKNYKEYHKPIYTLFIRGYAAIRIMQTILPHMGERRATKIREAIDIWNNRPVKKREMRLPPICHPEKRHYCQGLCKACYSNKQYHKNKRRYSAQRAEYGRGKRAAERLMRKEALLKSDLFTIGPSNGNPA
jgi:hypothetical protein